MVNPTIAAGIIRVYAGAQNIPGSTLGIGGPGGWSGGGTSAFLNNLAVRGQLSGANNPPTDFGPWGGSITFDNSVPWYFDSDITTVEPFVGMNDFYSVALHELAHLLGFGIAESWDTFVSGSTFTGAASMAENGGVAVPLDGGLGHWANGTQSEVLWPTPASPREASMDPSITVGTRKYFTELDFAGLDDIGWQVIPEPGTVGFLAGGTLLLGLLRRRRVVG